MIGEGRTRMEKYRVGIIGCGGIGRKHANAYAQVENVDLVAGADPSDRREAKYREIGVHPIGQEVSGRYNRPFGA